jgi:hypothetical protein
MTPQQVEFAARIARIEAGGGGRTATIFVGPDESFQFARGPKSRRRTSLATTLGNIFYPFSLVLCFGLGVLALGLGRYFRFHLTGIDYAADNPDIEILIDIATGLIIGMAFGLVDRMRLSDQVISRSLGVAIGSIGFHNLVHFYPQVFETLFSKMWVTRVLTTTEAHSLVWRGISFIF